MKTTFFDTFGSCKNAPRKPVQNKPGTSRPTFSFNFRDDWKFNRSVSPSLRVAPDRDGILFDADLMALAKQSRRALSSMEADLIWLAVAVYLADRCAPRYPYGMSGPAHWRRRIHLTLPVHDPSRWQSVEQPLAHALEFLTEDDWSFEFQSGRAAFAAENQGHFPQMSAPEVEWTALFSGGLDSLAGALHWLAKTRGAGLLVSGQTHSRITVGQEIQVAELRASFPRRIEHLGFNYGFLDKQKFDLGDPESSQRTRAFIHTALGSLAALMAGNEQLFLFENGFGALNLPCDSAQFGSMNSRGTHPVFLRRMAAFVSAAFERPFDIANPFTFSTKGQMLAAPFVREHASLLAQSFSCDRFPNYPHKKPQCGACPSCLVRRLAFHSADLPEDTTQYSIDIFYPRRPLSEAQWLSLSKLSVQADSLAACFGLKDPWPALCAHWPDMLLSEIELATPSFRDSASALLRRHMEEWRSFSAPFHNNTPALAA